MNIVQLRKGFKLVISTTETLDFPMFSSFDKKKSILEEERNRIDEEIDEILFSEGITHSILDQIRMTLWTEADKAARLEFGQLNEKKMLNGFYLQEVMHRYAELQESVILDRVVQ